MKIQDLVFLAVLLFLIFKRKPSWFAVAGLLCIVLAIPFFATWVFFTGQRLILYAAAFFLFSCLYFLFHVQK